MFHLIGALALIKHFSPMYGLVPAMDVAFRSSLTIAAMLKSVRWTWPGKYHNVTDAFKHLTVFVLFTASGKTIIAVI